MRQPILLLLAGITAFLAHGTAWSESVTLTVAGDVERPDTYIVELQGPATVLDLLVTAGVPMESKGIACLFQGSRPQFVNSEVIQRTGANRGAQLASGDVVIFHDAAKKQTGAGNVVIATGGMPRVVHLSEMDTTVAVLLDQLEVEYTTTDGIPLLRTEGGVLVPMKVLPDEVLVHGDVVQISVVKDVDPAVVSRLFDLSGSDADETAVAGIPHSEVNNTTSVPVAKTQSCPLPPADFGQEDVAEKILNALVVSKTADIGMDTFTQRPQIPLRDSPESLTASGPKSSVPSTPVPPSPYSTASADIPGNNREPADAEPLVTRHATVPGESRSSKQSGAARTHTLPTLVIPDPETTASTQSSHTSKADPPATVPSTSALWSTVFLFGLIGAIVLITTGWLKTRAEQKPAAVRARELMNLTVGDSVCEIEDAMPMPVETREANADAELERLIQNRIPMQLCQTDLPLRVTLFGRPAGPQRLRIDAAHSKVEAPHFASGSRRQSRSREQVQAVSGDPDHAESGSLDRALNSLRGHQQS